MIASRLARAARRPVVHFFVLGAGLWLAVGAFQQPAIVVRAADLASVRAQWIRETGREPNSVEWQASRARAIDEELLVREALRLRLDRSDPVVRDRLAKNLEFLDGAAAAPQRLEPRLEQARRLDMPARDPVTRRRLVQLMEARLAGTDDLSPADLEAFVAQHAERYAQPERRAFRQVFFSRDARGAKVHDDAVAALAVLTHAAPGAAPRGDAFLAGGAFAPMEPRAIAARLGEAVATALAQATPGRWVGPVASVWGEHLLLVERVEPAQAPSLDAVRTQVAYAALEAREQANVRAGLAGLRQRWRVEVEGS